MSEMKVNLKGPAGTIVAVIAICVFVYMEFFMPFSITSRDKKAIVEKITNARFSEISRITANMARKQTTTEKRDDNLKKIKELTGEVKIIDVKGKKSFLSGTKIKVVYTIGGKSPKDDGGVIYFKLYRRKTGRSRRRVELTRISKEDY